MHPPTSPSSPPDGALAEDPDENLVAAFMDRLARGAAPRGRPLEPALLVRRAPLVARLAERRSRERRLLLPLLLLEGVVAAAATMAALRLAADLGLERAFDWLAAAPGLSWLLVVTAAWLLVAWLRPAQRVSLW